MFIIIAVLLGIIIGFIRKGSIKGIWKNKPSLWYIGLIGIIIRIGLFFGFYFHLTINTYVLVLSLISYICIFVMLVFNLNHVWSIVVTVGTVANFLVVFLNGGQMPVDPNIVKMLGLTLSDSIMNGTNAVYMLMDQASTRLWVLGEYFGFAPLGKVTALYGAVPCVSIGDLLVLIGIAGWVQYAMSKNKPVIKDIFNDDVEDSDYILPEQKDGNVMSFRDATRDIIFDNHIQNDVESDEELFDKTEYIPRLTPEMIAEIRKNSLNGVENDQDKSEGDYGTKVFTKINTLTNADEDSENDTSDDIKEVFLQEEDFGFETGYEEEDKFNDFWENDTVDHKHRWKEWQPSSIGLFNTEFEEQNSIPEEPDDVEVQIPFSQASGQIVDFDAVDNENTISEKKQEWKPDQVEKNNFVSHNRSGRAQRNNPYSTLFNKDYSDTNLGRSSEEMRNIWRQVNEEDNLKRKRHYKPHYEEEVSSALPLTQPAENDLNNLKEVNLQKSDEVFEQAREKMAKKWDENTISPIELSSLPRPAETERVDSKDILRKSLDVKKEQQTADAVADLERQRAGFEKVELTIDGRKVSFWRKNKQNT